MMEFEFDDHHEVEDDDELDEEDDPANYESSLPNSSSRPFKMPVPGGAAEADRSRSQSPPPLPLSLSFPAGKKPTAPARYRECQKNHATAIGGHAVDGCGEFMPAGPEGSLDALKCAACNCHRNFHRREADPTNNHHHPNPPSHYPPIVHPAAAYFPPHPVFQFYPYNRSRPLALPASGGSRGEADEAEMISDPMSAMVLGGSSSSGKKRFRTKFTADQKEKMTELAEKLGWRLQKQDEAAIQRFCEETGVKRHVLKVWMHNNKHTLGKGNPSPT